MSRGTAYLPGGTAERAECVPKAATSAEDTTTVEPRPVPSVHDFTPVGEHETSARPLRTPTVIAADRARDRAGAATPDAGRRDPRYRRVRARPRARPPAADRPRHRRRRGVLGRPRLPVRWMTSKWVRTVAARRAYRVDWRFISLRLVNADVDYARTSRPSTRRATPAGLRLLRVAARPAPSTGPTPSGGCTRSWAPRSSTSELVPDAADAHGARGTRAFVEPILAAAGLPDELAEALDDSPVGRRGAGRDRRGARADGKDVGTPILQFGPPDGAAFFGPVISRLPRGDEAEELWDHVVGLARFPGFAELKRSLRELPQLRALGVGRGRRRRRAGVGGGEPAAHTLTRSR